MTPATAERHLHGCTYDNIVATTGNTPLVRLNRVIPTGHATVLGKCEFFNPLSSVKDRIGRSMIETGERDGLVNADTHIIEPTSGNTGIALAFVCAGKGYTLTLTMPESMSMERRGLLRALGANVVLTPADQGMKGAIEKAAELVATTGNAWLPQQFENPAYPAIHEATTGPRRSGKTLKDSLLPLSRAWAPAGRSPVWADSSSRASPHSRASPWSRRTRR
ncbi:MAG: pyridoxal-phosphate dependent enzyme [Phycisphaeraceae bacterium]|nr:pyridoxal-phosphate dependent enzyme [Phycisphaeraceae bacterium]